ncbi:phospholipid:diacylglycerol acyltransferase [Coemansia thaxteri]|uniref:Phospholipid:diacylglycerol acyltransferase n=1 Tax=Coemansia thaxteri TaxID=2663907 RepID=A0A9W8BIJ8_9FUNG|nr:phospholipid:diacylglycerol acyltransferase [Coemansia thaxteri]KAJ2008215.1 phospholipid:diacylglycerol acyltransferase [Coemansia thaxteri]KAJ2471821.1 phospholipid:diacylglycerol acyltransferase [Coemansia sp. RSA 2322]KAJ2487409.1 phospholipid:diacylglycerol acyltransferase [Coemansia sp. RSA 2320]
MSKETSNAGASGGGGGPVRRRNKNRKNGRQGEESGTLETPPALAENSGSEPDTPTATVTPRSDSQSAINKKGLELTGVILSSKLEKNIVVVSKRPGRVKRRRWFIAGIVFGVLAAVSGIFYVNPTKSEHIDRMHDMLGDFDIMSIVPDSLVPDDFIQDITRLLSLDSITYGASVGNYSKGDFQPALTLVSEERLEKVHNVILIPGIISSGLESWSTANCSRPYFRQRLWGTSTMFKAILLDKECWVQHMMLDKKTGLDPPGIKLRAAKGLDAADYFITGYWIWGKAIENLAVLGYDSNDMALAAYDWRLSYYDLERRDQYFSGLKAQIEVALRASSGRKTVLVTHSMGSQVMQYFLKWVESKEGGRGGDSWVNRHIEAVVNLAGTPLGVPKTLSSLLSGEQRETVQPLASYLLDHFMNRNELARVFRSWTGLMSLLPKGGDAVWGDLVGGAPDDAVGGGGSMVSYGAQIRFDDGSSKFDNQTMDDALHLLTRVLDKDALRLMQRYYSYGVFRTQAEMDEHADDHRMWTNPLQHQLPNAPNMTIFCLYGHGATTERAYYYTADNTESVDELRSEEVGTPALRIDKRQRNHVENVDIGIIHGEGDGTVPLLSLGYMCASGWRKPLYNPHGVRVVTREFAHSPLAAFKDIRGGAGASDHINILGNHDVTADMLRIVAGRGSDVKDQFSSDIQRYAERIKIP